MTSFADVILGAVGDTKITLDDLLFQLKTNLNQTVIDNTIHAILVRKTAQESGITVSDADLQQASDDFRKKAGLLTARETTEWIAQHGLTLDEFERKIEHDLLVERVQQRLASPDAQKKVFAQNILDFEQVKIARIVVNDANLAREIRAQIDDGEADFAVLAQKYSTDKATAEKGGFVGYVNRRDLPNEVDVAVFAEGASGVLGPIASQKSYWLIKILEPKKADVNDPLTQATLTRMIFEEAMAEKGRSLKTTLEF